MKKLLYVLDDGMRKFTYEWTSGLYNAIQRAEEDINLYIVRADGYAGFTPAHNRGECNIYRLPDYSEFDGILLDISNAFSAETNDYAVKGIRDAIDAAAASGKPVISMANYIEGFHYVGIDNYSAMASVIAHLHEIMGIADFWFAMGPEGNYENQIRAKALRDYCQAHGLPCGEDRFFFESFVVECGHHAFGSLLERHGGRLPRAVICANDQIALGVCQAAGTAGFIVPRDLMVTGFDNLDMTAYLSPSITTVDQLCWTMGDACINTMCRIWRGDEVPTVIYTPTELLLRETTGHTDIHARDNRLHVREFISRDASITEFRYKLSALQYRLPGCDSIREICQALTQCLEALDCKGIYLVLDQKLFESGKMIDFTAPPEQLTDADRFPAEGYSDTMELVYAWETGKKPRYTRRRLRRTLNPDSTGRVRENYLFAPLHFMEYTVGYLALWNCTELMRIRAISSVVNTLTMALRSFFARRDLSYINRMLSGISMKDELTGLYNRLGFHNLGHRLFREITAEGGRLGIVFIDMDRLKLINDTHGHASGDQAILCIANAIRRNMPRRAVAVRYGGDEFLSLIPADGPETIEAIVDAIRADIPPEARKLGVTDLPGISAGFVMTDPGSESTLDEYIDEADQLMYRQKRERQVDRIE